MEDIINMSENDVLSNDVQVGSQAVDNPNTVTVLVPTTLSEKAYKSLRGWCDATGITIEEYIANLVPSFY